jgi:hypothetical protein
MLISAFFESTRASGKVGNVFMEIRSNKQCCGSGIQCFFDPWIRDKFLQIPDLGSKTYVFLISEGLVTIFWVKIT